MADASTDKPRRPRRRSADDIVERVRHVLDDLGGMTVDHVIGVQTDDDDNWCVTVEVVELHRIPETSDILARYEVLMSGTGQFRSYRQLGRHQRGRLNDAP